MKNDSIGRRVVNIAAGILFIAGFCVFWGAFLFPLFGVIPQIFEQFGFWAIVYIAVDTVIVSALPAFMCWGCLLALIDYIKG